MAGRIYWIGGYPHTLDMQRANQACQSKHALTLREYLLQWRDAHPADSFEVLAAEFGRHLSSIYRWFDRLDIAPGGPVLRDLSIERRLSTGTDG